jgi:hypothetical protein
MSLHDNSSCGGGQIPMKKARKQGRKGAKEMRRKVGGKTRKGRSERDHGGKGGKIYLRKAGAWEMSEEDDPRTVFGSSNGSIPSDRARIFVTHDGWNHMHWVDRMHWNH